MDNINTETRTFRFKFSPDVNEHIQDFSSLHMYDTSINLKENYDNFWETNVDLFMREKQRLEMNGFSNNLKTAMFRSIKYYHIKKLKKSSENSEQTTPISENTNKSNITRDYIKLNKFIIQFIDMFIMNSLNSKKFKPSTNFDEIYNNKEFQDLLKDEKPKIMNKYKKYLDDKSIEFNNEDWETWWQCKIKKTHKNRYYCIMKNVKKDT